MRIGQQAADAYVASRALELAPASRTKEKHLLVPLRAYFQQEPLRAITAPRILEYRVWRANQSRQSKATGPCETTANRVSVPPR